MPDEFDYPFVGEKNKQLQQELDYIEAQFLLGQISFDEEIILKKRARERYVTNNASKKTRKKINLSLINGKFFIIWNKEFPRHFNPLTPLKFTGITVGNFLFFYFPDNPIILSEEQIRRLLRDLFNLPEDIVKYYREFFGFDPIGERISRGASPYIGRNRYIFQHFHPLKGFDGIEIGARTLLSNDPFSIQNRIVFRKKTGVQILNKFLVKRWFLHFAFYGFNRIDQLFEVHKLFPGEKINDLSKIHDKLIYKKPFPMEFELMQVLHPYSPQYEEQQAKCVHTAIMLIDPQLKVWNLQNLSKDLTKKIITRDSAISSEFKRVTLSSEEHFVSLKSFVAGINEFGLKNCLQNSYESEDINPCTLLVGFNLQMHYLIIGCLRNLALKQTVQLVQDLLIYVAENSPGIWFLERISLFSKRYIYNFKKGDVFSDMLYDIVRSKIDREEFLERSFYKKRPLPE
jgi:hypothetical protein